MIIASNCVALCIEYWKLQRACHFSFSWGSNSWVPVISWNIYDDVPAATVAANSEPNTHTDATVAQLNAPSQDPVSTAITASATKGASDVKSETDQHDEVAVTHLLYIVVPLVVGYSVYSYLYLLHKSYYSWIIKSLVGFVYAFGFILMTPQVGPIHPLPYYKLSNSINVCVDIYKLQAQVSGAHAVEGDGVQEPQHLHRRPVRLHREDAHHAPPRLSP